MCEVRLNDWWTWIARMFSRSLKQTLHTHSNFLIFFSSSSFWGLTPGCLTNYLRPFFSLLFALHVCVYFNPIMSLMRRAEYFSTKIFALGPRAIHWAVGAQKTFQLHDSLFGGLLVSFFISFRPWILLVNSSAKSWQIFLFFCLDEAIIARPSISSHKT